MDGKQLKNSILQWAIQGKLVPQNPKDEPAQKLLERIAAFRNGDVSPWSEAIGSSKNSKKSLSTSLRGAKATKQSKALSSRIYRENGVWYEQIGTATPKDITDEIPFEIPETWAWCRVERLFDVWSARRVHEKDWRKKGIPFYRAREIGKLADFGTVDNELFIDQSLYEEFSETGVPKKNDMMITAVGTLGKVYVIKDDKPFYFKDGSVLCMSNKANVDPLFYKHCIESPFFRDQYEPESGGTTVATLTMVRFNKYLVPLPPLAEQKRIVAKLEQVFPLAEEYGAAQEQLDKLNKELPETLKKSILQEAIQGKLVPQNPKDEPAQKLLERTALARHSERSEESSKRSKRASKDLSSRIYRENGVWYEQVGSATHKDITDEIPFEIPETWAWCRLGNCSDYAASKEKAKSFDDIQEMWSLDLEDIEKNSGRIVKRLKVSERKIVGEKVVFKKGQVLYSKLRPYLKKILVAPEDGVCSSEIVPFSPFECLNASYLVTVLKSPHVDYTINLVTYGVKMPRVGTDTMLNLLIPIPPLAEQKRIIAKLEQLFKVL